ncbi:MAG: hypothetical protein ACOYWZ_11040 [Bacillota bacterium]
MKYLEDAFKFLGKFFILIIPLFIASAIPSMIVGGTNTMEMTNRMNEFSVSMAEGSSDMLPQEIFGMLFEILQPFFILVGISLAVSLVLYLVVMPATYGMINKALATGNASLSDFLPELKNNFVKYILFGICSFLVSIIITIILAVIIALFVFLIIALQSVSTTAMVLGIVIGVLIGIAIILLLMAFGFLLVYWFPAMVVDDLDVVAGFKKSIEVAKSYFWPTVGITLLISIAGSVANSVLGFFGMVPVIGGIFISIVPTMISFITTVFYIMVYRDKTGKNVSEEDNMPELPGEYV